MALILNNTNRNLAVIIQGQFTAARFLLAPNMFQSVNIARGLKALIGFSNSGLFALRPINSTADPRELFLIDPSGIGIEGGVIFSQISESSDLALIEGMNDTGIEVLENDLIQPLNPS